MSVCLFLCWSVGFCRQDYTKSVELISMKLGQRMGLGPERTLLTFGADLDKGMNPGFFLTFFL